MKQDQEDPQGCQDHQAQVVVREFQETLEIQGKWVNQVIEDQMGLLEKLDLMVNQDLQVPQGSQDFLDQRVQEGFRDFQVIQD